jgi:hypothetical protein
MKTRIIVLLICFLFIDCLYAQTGVTKNDYFLVIKDTEENIWKANDREHQLWQKSDPAKRSPNPPEMKFGHGGKFDALLYSVTGEKIYAERARTLLLHSDAGDHTVATIRRIEKSGVLSEADLKILKEKIVKSANWAVEYWTEWGAMNHSTNHVVNLLTSIMEYLPDHPDYPRWKQKLDINLSSSWGLWSIEDSQNYIPIWLRPMMEYAEMTGREKEFYDMPMTKYYFDYFVQMMTPDGEIPEFGDGGTGSAYGWPWYVSVLEKGASIYHDGKMKWAARRIFQRNVNSARDYERFGFHFNYNMVEAYLWADDSIPEEIPSGGSRLILEDYIGKKIVFRNGWKPNATYLFLNYLEDAPFGVDGKEHIINTINVETEKNHHGQADENAIALLMKDGSILLSGSGYRETSSTGPDGQFRADTYKNKLIVRSGLADSQMRLLPFLLDGGRYKFVDTKLMHFRRFKDVDISRTRLTDENMGYQWDRLINYLKGREWFVVYDIVKILKDGEYTLANLFYTQDVTAFDHENRSWYDTRYRTFGTFQESNPDNARLLIYFPEGTKFRRGVEQLRRSYQTESAVYTAKADSLKAGDIIVFTTFLIPHAKDIDPKSIISTLSNLEIYHTDRGYGLKLPTEDGFIQLNAMLDLEAEYLQQNLRPRYNFDSGRAEYGNFVTDARYCYLHKQKNQLFYSFFKASKLIYNGKPIFEAKGQMIGQDDGSYQRWGVSKWIAWEDEVLLKDR